MRRNVEINGLGPDPDVLMESVDDTNAAERTSRKDAALGKVRVNEGDAWCFLLFFIE